MADAGLGELYREILLDHAHAPRNRRALDTATSTGRELNPLCGDDVALALRLLDGKIADAAFEGEGCAISQASASMLTERIRGLSVVEARELAQAIQAMMASVDAPPPPIELGDLAALLGVRRFRVRVKCALLPWLALQQCLDSCSAPPPVGPCVSERT